MIFGSFSLVSALPRAECRSRLAVIAQGVDSLGGTRPLVGSVTDNILTVQQNLNSGRSAVYIRHSFQPTLTGKLLDDNGGTIIHCRIGPHPTLIYLLIAFAAACVLLSGYNLIDYMSAPAASEPNPALMGGIGIIAYVTFEGDTKPLVDLVADAINARRSD